MREKAFLFGKHKSMLALCTEPAAPVEGRPTVILLNAGVVHRAGPHRSSVKIARRLAAEGFPVMRFDLAGVGDSEPRRDALSFEEGAVSDVIEAMDHLHKTRTTERFVLMGLCSGADNAYQVACRDPRVVGALMMDGYAYPTPEFRARHLVHRARGVRSWRALARRTIAALTDRVMAGPGAGPGAVDAALRPGAAAGEPIRQYVREFPPRDRVATELVALAARGVRLHFIYSGGMPQYYNYARQFSDSFKGFDLRGMVTSEFFPGTDHTFTELRSQQALIAAVVRWTRSSFSRRT